MTQWFLDACSLINLYASGQLDKIAEQQAQPLLLVPKVVEEATWLYARDGRQRGDRVSIELGPLIEQGAIQIIGLTQNIRAHYIRIAVDLDDGEAMTIAAALEHSKAGIITDDEAALKYLARECNIRSLTSLSLLREQLSEAPLEICLEVILNLRICARYVPGPRHPEVDWWRSFVEQAHDT